jgi:hypothetical protein
VQRLSKSNFSKFYRTRSVNPPDSIADLPTSRDGYRTSLVPPPDLFDGPDLFGPWPTSRGLVPASKDQHRTCPLVVQDLSGGPDMFGLDRLPVPRDYLLVASHRSSLVDQPSLA